MKTDEKFVFALDLDGVTAHYTTGLAAVVEEDRGLESGSLPEPTDWHFTNWDLSKGEFSEYHEMFVVGRRGFQTLEVFPGASEALWRLSDADVWIRVLTHRLGVSGHHSTLAADTIGWLEQNDIPYRDICFMAEKSDLSANLYVDDGPHNITALQDAGRHVVIFDQPYNQELEGPRVKSWAELEVYVLKCMELWDKGVWPA